MLTATSTTNSISHRGPLAAALALMLATAGIGVWLHTRMAQQQAESMAAFDPNTAMLLAGKEVPDEIESFYFFTLDRTVADETGELALKMSQAAGEHEFLGIAGADPQYNLSVLLAALAAPRERTLAGLIIIFVGPAGQEADVRLAVNTSGAELRYAPYTPMPPPAPAKPDTI